MYLLNLVASFPNLYSNLIQIVQYINKANYGKIPQYLSKRKDTDKKYKTEYNKHVAAQQDNHAIMKMSQEDRDRIISGLKANWEELHHQYQGLSVVTDTGTQWF